MKVLLVTSSYKNAWPFLPELRNALLCRNITVHILDVTLLELIDENGKSIRNTTLSKINILRGGHRFIKYTAKNFIQKNLGSYDAINIHNLEYIYLHLIDELKKHSAKVILSVWGSDFYRASENRLQSYKPLFEKLDGISFGNSYTKKDFEKKVIGFDEKLRTAGFGIGKFEILHHLLPQKNDIKKELGITPHKISVVCGYNAFPAQQHLLLLEQIKNLPEDIKKVIILVFPLTYGGDDAYKSRVIEAAEETHCEYKTFTDFAGDEEIAKIRIVGDIILNAQTSDTFSASLQEHLVCNSVLIAGEWLPYQVMTDLGLTYFPVSAENFGDKLKEVVSDYDSYKNRVSHNSEILYNDGVWENRVNIWINLYKAADDQTVS